MNDFAYFRLRIPLNLKERIEKEACIQHRSLNAEILSALTSYYKTVKEVDQEICAAIEKRNRPPTINERIDALEKAVFTNTKNKEHPIAKYRILNKWSQEDLAKKLSVPRFVILQIENNKMHIDGKLFTKLCQIFSISLETLIDELNEYK